MKTPSILILFVFFSLLMHLHSYKRNEMCIMITLDQFIFAPRSRSLFWLTKLLVFFTSNSPGQQQQKKHQRIIECKLESGRVCLFTASPIQRTYERLDANKNKKNHRFV